MLREGKNIFLARQFSARPRLPARRGHGFHTRPMKSAVFVVVDSSANITLATCISTWCFLLTKLSLGAELSGTRFRELKLISIIAYTEISECHP